MSIARHEQQATTMIRGEREKNGREKKRESAPIGVPLPLSLSLAHCSTSPSASSARAHIYNAPIHKTNKNLLKTDGLKHFSSLPSPWCIPLVGHGPLLGRAPAATLRRWAEKHGGVYR